MKRTLWIPPLILLTACAAIVAAQETDERVLQHGGKERTYRLRLPNGKKPPNGSPLVLVLHGGGGKAGGMITLTKRQFHALADKDGAVLVYPQGTDNHWNDGRDVSTYEPHRANIDDVGFLSEVIESVAKETTIDRKRIYATGISNGAMMSYRLAVERPDLIAAIAPVVGCFPAAIASRTLATPVAVIGFYGTDDPLVPYNGGDVHFGSRKLGKVLSAPDSVRLFVKWNGCEPMPRTELLPDGAEDETRVRRETWAGKAPVVLYTIEKGGHTWPSGMQYLPEAIIGKTCRDVNASELIWTFFKENARP